MLASRFLRAVGFAAALIAVVLLASVIQAADKRGPSKKKGVNRKAVAKAVAKAQARQAAQLQAAQRQAAQLQAAQTNAQIKAAARKRNQKAAANSAAKAAPKSAPASAIKATPVAATATKRTDSTAARKPLPRLPAVAASQPAAAAAEADRRLAAEITVPASASAAAKAGDEVYLRRVSLDIAGRLPTPGEITAFVLDSSPNKRTAAVERLLAEEAYGENWGRYWRDVIMYRRSDDRAMIAAESLERHLTSEFNKNTPWDEIARAFITATGDIRENGATAIMMAQMGETSDITAEISRIFTGIQIQCAQCHDHPTDRWERSQFHELAAFFPRIAVRPKRGAMPRTFEVASADRAPLARRPNNAGARGSQEHFMPDLDNPQARGTRMQPVFFVTGQELLPRTTDPDITDMERRESIARWITAAKNPWFAKALVNRMWSELVGEGFYEPVDDIGPDREATAPATLEYLAAQFAANRYDIKWLLRTITATEAYQRQSRSRRGPEETPMLANVSQRLRGDQLYTAITSVVGTPLAMPGAGRRRGGNARDPRFGFNAVFGFDPSVRRDDVAGSIPQALALTNSPQLAAGLNANRRGTQLGKLLLDQSDDEAVAVDLYLRTLSREPTAGELKTCLTHVKESKSRGEGFEDVLWALLNSAEFMHRK